MKMKPVTAAIVLVVAASAHGAGDHHQAGDDHKPLHGGVVAATKLMDYELVARPAVIRLYLRDHGKPVDVGKASARVTLLSGAGKQDVALKPAGDRLEATGAFKVGPGTKAVATVTVAGKPFGNVRFTVE